MFRTHTYNAFSSEQQQPAYGRAQVNKQHAHTTPTRTTTTLTLACLDTLALRPSTSSSAAAREAVVCWASASRARSVSACSETTALVAASSTLVAYTQTQTHKQKSRHHPLRQRLAMYLLPVRCVFIGRPLGAVGAVDAKKSRHTCARAQEITTLGRNETRGTCLSFINSSFP